MEIKGARFAITGGAGSVGQRILAILLDRGAGMVRVIDNNESALFEMERRFEDHPECEFYCCDVCDEGELRRCLSGIDYCFHTAALKHVPSCERSPFSAVNVNIRGTEAVIRASFETGIRKVLFTSSDKAVNPTNVMGTSKLMGERLFTAANVMGGSYGRDRPVFASTRFGNVAGSSGSVIPLFSSQIAKGGPVTLTDGRMTRFMMTLQHAAELVVNSIRFTRGGEVFVTKMPVVRIADLARVMIDLIAPLYGWQPDAIEIRPIGVRPGEKMWEELSSDEEARRIYEGKEYLVILPALQPRQPLDLGAEYPGLGLEPSPKVYHSDRETRMTDEQILDFLKAPEVLPEAVWRRLRQQEPLARAGV